MINLQASQIAKIVGGELVGTDVTVTAEPVFNSSQATEGSIFLALVGEKTDGHKYISDAFEHGAVLAFATSEVPERCIVVKDVITSLNLLASFVRNALPDLKVIALF
mgnify:FL=1